MVETWRGIYPITSFVLEALGRKRDASVDGILSAEEQILLTVVEFWGAAAHGTLQEHLQPDVRHSLDEARQAFATVGAVRVVSLLRVAGEQLGSRTLRIPEVDIIEQLDERLSRTDDNIEDLIARYAGVIDQSAESAIAQ